ncbi:hypothetical protein GGQ84_000530 [Desulfitispora alkaliphila]|uniref:hypothetical protein n=1 Tax=Desulfitispora alkaliphila TaxID=622674 RepID=UPI003D24F781
MRIETTCENRKELVKSIGEFLGEKPKYVGPPSYAYRAEGFIIERDGTVVSETEMDGERMRAHLEEQGFVEPMQQLETLEVSVPLEGMEGLALQNLIYMLKSKQYLLNRVVGKEQFSINDEFINALQTNLPENKEEFLNLCSESAEAISGLSFEDDKVTFTFPGSEKPKKNRAYVELAAMMVAHAKEAKRISPKVSEPENEKYYLRVWLVRLGLGGSGAKESRKALLEGLKGHTAFRTPDDAEKHKARLRERKEGDGHDE